MACSKSQCTDLCFSEDCNQEVNNAKDKWNNTPFHRAAENGRVDVVKQLLENTANLDRKNKYGQTALFVAAIRNNVDLANLLLANSANVNSGDFEGATALYYAAWKNSVNVARLLLRYSANLHATAVRGYWGGKTPLQVAELYRNREMVELLRNA